MTFAEWPKQNNVDLKKYHGNIGDYDGNICIEKSDGWVFWNREGEFEKIII